MLQGCQRTLPHAFCCTQEKPPGGATSVHPEEAAPWVAAGWLQRPQVSAHQPAWAIQDWLHWPHSFFWAHVVPSAVGNGRKVGRRGRRLIICAARQGAAARWKAWLAGSTSAEMPHSCSISLHAGCPARQDHVLKAFHAAALPSLVAHRWAGHPCRCRWAWWWWQRQPGACSGRLRQGRGGIVAR